MAKVKITGHASGTGILTVTAPNTSTDRTITLPDGDVTLGAATPSIDDNGNATAITIDASEDVKFHHNFTSASDGAVNGEWRSDWAGLQVGTTSAHYLALRAGNTEQLRIHTDGRGVSQFTAKAWVNFNGTGTLAIRDSHNVSSVVDNTTGDYSIMFDTNLANANFAGAGLSAADGNFVSFRNGITWNNAGYARVCHQSTSTKTDGDTITFMFFGD